MKFGPAIEHMRAGGVVARSSNPMILISYNGAYFESRRKGEVRTRQQWWPTANDMLADDWVTQ